MKFFVAGGMYGSNLNKAFQLVQPTAAKPYVVKDEEAGLQLGRLTQHHASLYVVIRDGTHLQLVRQGEMLENPVVVKLTEQQRQEIEKESLRLFMLDKHAPSYDRLSS